MTARTWLLLAGVLGMAILVTIWMRGGPSEEAGSDPERTLSRIPAPIPDAPDVVDRQSEEFVVPVPEGRELPPDFAPSKEPQTERSARELHDEGLAEARAAIEAGAPELPVELRARLEGPPPPTPRAFQEAIDAGPPQVPAEIRERLEGPPPAVPPEMQEALEAALEEGPPPNPPEIDAAIREAESQSR